MKKRIGTFDAETDPFKAGREPQPFVWGLYLDDHFTHFWGDDCTDNFLEYLQDEEDIILYAHNGGKFDFFFFLSALDAELFIINGRIVRATLFDGRVEIRDSYAILPLPLSSHGKDDIDYNKMEQENREKNKAEIINYLKTDCHSLHTWVTEFINEFGLNLTLAGTAFKQLRKTSYETTRTFEDYDEKLRPYYLGGRVQCFEVGNFSGDYSYVDINSAYPYAMVHDHWYGSQTIEHLRIPDTDNGSYFVDCYARSFGALPYRDEKTKKLYFPDDGISRRFKASGWEIIAGLETGTLKIDRVIKVYKPLFKQSFREYVDKFFAMKLDAEREMALYKGVNEHAYLKAKTKRQFAKLMLNSCYGKFGQDGRKFEKYCIMEFGDWPVNNTNWPENQRWKFYCDGPNDTTIFSRDDPVNRFFNVATAASVTGFVRAYLWKAINQCERPLYCDTDSIICEKFNGSISDKLGDWDLEAKFSEIHIAQRKMYAGKTTEGEYKIASKGVKFSFENDIAFNSIKNSIKNRSIVEVKRDAPSYSLKYGARFIDRKINFENIEQNACANPPQ